MPTVECSRFDCEKHGIEICIAKRVNWIDGNCSEYMPRRGKKKNILDAPFNPHCRRSGGKYKSDRITGVLK